MHPLASLEGSAAQVQQALVTRRRALERIAHHAGMSAQELVERAHAGRLQWHNEAIVALARQPSAAWWIEQRDAPIGVLLARATTPGAQPASTAAAPHPVVDVAVISRSDGALPRAAQALLQAQAPRGIRVYRATDEAGPAAPRHVRDALHERGLEAPEDPPRPTREGAAAEIVVSVGDVPRVGDEYRGKRVHLWRARYERPLDISEARAMVGELEAEANCLVAAYRQRAHPRRAA